MRKQNIFRIKKQLFTEVEVLSYLDFFSLPDFQIFLHQSQLICPFDRLYALKPKNPE